MEKTAQNQERKQHTGHLTQQMNAEKGGEEENRPPPAKPRSNSNIEEGRDESDTQPAAARDERKEKEETSEKENIIRTTMGNYLKEFFKIPKENQKNNPWTQPKQKGRKNETHTTKPRKK